MILEIATITRTITSSTTITSSALNPALVPARDPTFALGYFAFAMGVTGLIILVRILQVRKQSSHQEQTTE